MASIEKELIVTYTFETTDHELIKSYLWAFMHGRPKVIETENGSMEVVGFAEIDRTRWNVHCRESVTAAFS